MEVARIALMTSWT